MEGAFEKANSLLETSCKLIEEAGQNPNISFGRCLVLLEEARQLTDKGAQQAFSKPNLVSGILAGAEEVQNPIELFKEYVESQRDDAVDLGQVVEGICQIRHDIAKISVTVQTAKVSSASPLGIAGEESRDPSLLGKEAHAEALQQIQTWGTTLQQEYPAALTLGHHGGRHRRGRGKPPKTP